MLINYSSNNSGGRWWLKDEDWLALEKAGWTVEWKRNQEPIKVGGKSFQLVKKDGRYLGALATEASKEFETPGEAMREFEKITGQDVSDEGCNCCGAPHSFNWGGKETGIPYDYGSGESCLPHMFKKVPRSLRDACED